MIEFIIMLLIVAVGVLLFGKADSKREVLNQVGLDLSGSNYENLKAKEFKKNCKRAIKNAIELYNVTATSEKEFLHRLYRSLNNSCNQYNEDEPHYYLSVSPNYINHAMEVVKRRLNAIKENKETIVVYGIDFNNKEEVKQRYVKVLWEKYQDPWPENWINCEKERFLTY